MTKITRPDVTLRANEMAHDEFNADPQLSDTHINLDTGERLTVARNGDVYNRMGGRPYGFGRRVPQDYAEYV